MRMKLIFILFIIQFQICFSQSTNNEYNSINDSLKVTDDELKVFQAIKDKININALYYFKVD